MVFWSVFEIYDVIFHEDDDEHDEHSSASVEFWLMVEPGRGAQIRTVASSDADANIDGYTGFHDTQFTVRVWPDNRASGSSRFMCQMYTCIKSKMRKRVNDWSDDSSISIISFL